MTPSKDQDFLDRLADHLRAQQVGNCSDPGSNGHASGTAARLYKGSAAGATDDAVVGKCREAKNAAKFEALYDRGDVHAYHGGDESSADLALLGMLAFWTQDAAQLERIFSASALGRRRKWRDRPDYRRRTIEHALKDLGEVYDWHRKNGRRPRSDDRHRHRHSIYDGDDDDRGEGAEETRIPSISFAEMPEPERPEEVWEGIIVRGWPALWFGGTGVTKSVTALAVAQAIADKNTNAFLGRGVITASVMYADWELNAVVQGRRAYHIARGHGRGTPPAGLRYMSTYGTARHARANFGQQVLEECVAHEVEVCFIDSVGLAVSGNPGDFETIIHFFDETIADFVANGITPVLIDHQRRLAAGERNQSLGAYGSVWKENLSRTQLQIELVTRDRDAHTVTTRLRAKKTNFDELPEPIEVRTTFTADAITLEAVVTEDTDRAAEETLSAKDRVLAAVRALGEAGPNAIQEACGTLTKGTVKNALSQLRRAGVVQDTGGAEPGGGRVVTLAESDRNRNRTFKGDDDDYDSVLSLERALEAFRYGNAPRMARNNFRKQIQDFPSVVKSVLHYWQQDTGRWEEAAPSVLEALETLEEEGGA
ncbi:MAG: hypothetical protein CYG60_20115 [Actinobacteria bacterium]|nr:MAG: hypothetical protein CYG60_20115 [Actinomycetota bacterium]